MSQLAMCTAEEPAQPTPVAPGVGSRPLPFRTVFAALSAFLLLLEAQLYIIWYRS